MGHTNRISSWGWISDGHGHAHLDKNVVLTMPIHYIHKETNMPSCPCLQKSQKYRAYHLGICEKLIIGQMPIFPDLQNSFPCPTLGWIFLYHIYKLCGISNISANMKSSKLKIWASPAEHVLICWTHLWFSIEITYIVMDWLRTQNQIFGC